ncbi:MAG: type II toxin-antitoxin system prevent-host-death family antitoxin [Chromatiales bacterium]|jgi:prevent-host-death family protein|nr:type II toxin-antitoxin system prevent-host-death family antitoxin [Chromatiales bacterium]
MQTVSKSELKSKMLEYFRHIEESGEELIVTSYGKPVARVVPYAPAHGIDELFSDLRGRVVYHRPVAEPTTDEWGEV